MYDTEHCNEKFPTMMEFSFDSTYWLIAPIASKKSEKSNQKIKILYRI